MTPFWESFLLGIEPASAFAAGGAPLAKQSVNCFVRQNFYLG